MNKLIKQTSKTPVLSGYEKTAILLGELGKETGNLVLRNLNLSVKQSKKIRKAMKKLGKYNPDDYFQVGKEIQVLSETVSFLRNRLTIRGKSTKLAINLETPVQKDEEISNVAKQKPDEIAKILKSWLGD